MLFFTELVGQWGGRTAFTRALGDRHLRGKLPADVTPHLGSWASLDDIIMTRRLVPPELSIVNAGRAVDARKYTVSGPTPRRRQQPIVDPEGMHRVLGDGATLVINNLHEIFDPVIDASFELSALVGERVQANAYATWGRTHGFDPHWDDHDVLIVQIEGEKHWDVYGPGTAAPVDHAIDTTNIRPEHALWSGTLAAGDVLYLPRGWWHDVRGTGVTSLHLTFGFQRRTALTYLTWLNQHFQREHALRIDIPRADADADAVTRHQQSVESAVIRLIQQHPLSEYVHEFVEKLDQRSRLDLGSIVAPAMPEVANSDGPR